MGGGGDCTGPDSGDCPLEIRTCKFEANFCMALNGDVGSDKFDACLLPSLFLVAVPSHFW